MMSISELSQRSLQKLYSSLESAPTLDWKVLMKKGFDPPVYSENDVTAIGATNRPAKALIDDLNLRRKTLQDLLEGLEVIGNIEAASIVKKG